MIPHQKGQRVATLSLIAPPFEEKRSAAANCPRLVHLRHLMVSVNKDDVVFCQWPQRGVGGHKGLPGCSPQSVWARIAAPGDVEVQRHLTKGTQRWGAEVTIFVTVVGWCGIWSPC